MKLLSTIKHLAGIAFSFIKGHVPEILTGTGVVTGALSMIFSNKVSMSPKLKQIKAIEEKSERVKKLIVAYIPSGALYVVSTGCYIASCIVARRYLKMALTSVATLTATLAAYRGEVREEVGEEKEAEIYERVVNKVETQRWDPTISDWDDIVYTITPVDNMPNYVSIPIKDLEWRFRDRTLDDWIAMVEKSLNDQLAVRGYVSVNEILNAMGLPPIVEWARIGWILEPGVKRVITLKPHYDTNINLTPFYDREDPLTIEFHPMGYIGTEEVDTSCKNIGKIA